jgi:uncharacterized damage-inducible protein DinB
MLVARFQETLMRHTLRSAAFVTLMLGFTLPLGAQDRQGVMGELLRDVGQVEKKIVGLAKAMPDAAYEYRPGKGVRSTSEVLMHIAADNYFIPGVMGIAPPKDTGITREYDTAAAFEKKALSRDQVVAELEKSFAFLRTSMQGMPDAQLETAIVVFGSRNTNRGFWLMATTHLHEHLGQLIAYARANNVTPPWSR